MRNSSRSRGGEQTSTTSTGCAAEPDYRMKFRICLCIFTLIPVALGSPFSPRKLAVIMAMMPYVLALCTIEGDSGIEMGVVVFLGVDPAKGSLCRSQLLSRSTTTSTAPLRFRLICPEQREAAIGLRSHCCHHSGIVLIESICPFIIRCIHALNRSDGHCSRDPEQLHSAVECWRPPPGTLQSEQYHTSIRFWSLPI